MAETENFLLHLVDRVPDLANVLREHQAEYDEVLPHVLMGDVSRLALRLAGEAQEGSGSAEAALTRLLEELERGLQEAGDPVGELIVVSFLENLDDEDPRFPGLENHFGPQLQWEWSRIGEA